MGVEFFLGDLLGVIFSVGRNSTYDGPGIRTVVFLKGCNLLCPWCSTPESQLLEKQAGYRADKCVWCWRCVEGCPRQALGFENNAVIRHRDRCDHCWKCVDGCPVGAMISYGYSITVEELMKELVKDEVFFFHSEGGITLSGGEPLVQAEFSAAVLKACKERQIGTAIETSLCVPYDKVEAVLPWLDHLYLDIKHMDTLVHRKYTGQGNELVLENLRLIDQSAFPGAIVIRVPLIPGINDDTGNIYQTARFCAGLKKKTVLELLPYHLMGVGTYQILGLEYRFKELKSYDRDQAEELVAQVKQSVPEQQVRLAGG